MMENQKNNNQLPEDKMPNWDFPSGSFDDTVSADGKKDRKKQAVNVSTKALALVGLVALIALIVWGGSQAVRTLPSDLASNIKSSLVAAVSNITSVFVPNREENSITFTIPTHSVTAEEPFELSWAHDENRDGTYLFRHGCRDGVEIEIADESGVNIPVVCETPHTLEGNDSLVFTAYSSKDRFVDIPVTISFVPNDTGEATAQVSTLLTVTNEALDSIGIKEDGETGVGTVPTAITPGTQTNETQIIGVGGGSTNGGGVSDPNGTPDLAVTVIATGVVDKITNDFTPLATVGQNERAAIRFEVRNVGTKASGEWSFIIDLPISSGMFVFRPDSKQRNLNPGERIEYTLGFDSIARTTDTVEAIINIDTERVVAETNRINNVTPATISVDNS